MGGLYWRAGKLKKLKLPYYYGANTETSGAHGYEIKTKIKHLVHEYTGLNFNEIGDLNYLTFLEYRRDAYIHRLDGTAEGREYLRNAWRMEQVEPDRAALRRRFGKEEVNGE